MKQLVTICLFVLASISLKAQTGSIEMSTGGFSFIPAFTSKEPNLIIMSSMHYNNKFLGIHCVNNDFTVVTK